MRRSRWILALLAGLLGAAMPAAAAIFACGELPVRSTTNNPRSTGNIGGNNLKSIELRFGPAGCAAFNAGDRELPLSLPPAATATLRFGATTLSCRRNSNTPPLGQCGFALVHSVWSPSPSPIADTVQVFYNQLLPAGATVTVDIDGVQDALGSTAAGFTWSFRISSTSRDPASLELVFDTSGSMDWPAVPGPGTRIKRIDALRDASAVVFAILDHYALPGDQIGLVTFDHAPKVFDPTPGGSNLEPADVPANRAAVANTIRGLTPGGATSIGGGLAAADTAGLSLAPRGSRKAVVLFSDGEQNTEPCVKVDGTALRLITGAGCPERPSATGPAYDDTISICPITAGLMIAPGFALQQAIAAKPRCGGQNAHIRDDKETFVAADLETYLVQAMARILVGDKLELVRDVTGDLPAGATVVTPFLANPDDVAMSILLAWPRGADLARLPFRLEAPDGTFVEVEGRTSRQSGLSLTTLRLPQRQGTALIPTAGQWKSHLGNVDVPALSYHLVVLLDNASLVSEFTMPAAAPGTSESIPLRAQLSEGGAPVLGATVTATVSGPKEGLGDVLSGLPDLRPVESSDVGANPGANGKLRALLADPAAARLADHPLGTVVLVDDGSPANGDAKAGDGVYSGLFRGAGEEGHYHFAFAATGKAPANGGFERTYRIAVFAQPKPDPTRRLLRLASVTPNGSGGSLLELEARPQDALGNLLGPGYLGSLAIDLDVGTVKTPLADTLDGTYGITWDVPAGARPRATLTVLGRPVIDQPVSRLPTTF